MKELFLAADRRGLTPKHSPNQDCRKGETDKLYLESIPGEREEPCLYTTIYVHTPKQPQGMNIYLLYQYKISNKLNQFNCQVLSGSLLNVFKSTFYKSRLATGPIHWLTRSDQIILYEFKNCPISSGVYYINWPSVLGKQIPMRVSAFGIYIINQVTNQCIPIQGS